MSRAPAKVPSSFVETTIDDEAVVMSLASGEFFSLSGSARAIWDSIDGTRDRAGLIEDLAGRYGVAPETLAPDVDAFLAELADAGFIDEAGRTDPPGEA